MRDYRHVVLALCIAIFVFAAFTAVASASYKEIGSGTEYEYKVPFYGIYDYGWSKIIYTQSEIGEAITIDKIAFDVSNTPSSYTVLDQRIYMAHTTDNTCSSAKPDPATMTEVYTGSITWDGSGWHNITLDTSFTYDNADNLLIYYENRDGSYDGGYPKWYYTSKSNRAAYEYADDSFPTGSGIVWVRVPNVRLYYTHTGPKTLSSLTATQASTEYVTQDSTNNPILRLDFGVTGINDTLNLTEITVTSNNTDNSDIASNGVKAYRTSAATFSTEHQFGSATSFSAGMATFTDTYDLPSGTTYIWITYDIASGATLGHKVDAKVLANNVTVNSSTYPASDQDPAGSREISGCMEIGTGTSDERRVPLRGPDDYGWSKIIYTASEMISADINITTIAFDVSTPSSYTFTNQRIYMAHTTDDTFANGSKPDPSTMTEVYNGSITYSESGWCAISLDTNFLYSHPYNLLIYYENRHGSDTWDYPEWYYTSKTNRSAYKSQDDSFPTGAGTVSYYVPNIKLCYNYIGGAKSLSSLTGVQASTDCVAPGSTNNSILRMDFEVTGTDGTLNLTEIKVTSNNTDDSDITSSGVKAYRTSTATFSPEHQFGSAASFASAATITGNYDLPAGTTYLWITYDIAAGAAPGNITDAKVTANNVTVNSSTYPASDIDPAGNCPVCKDIYVPDDYGTIQDAVNAASPGDTIIVRDGTYTENVIVNKRLLIRSENGSASTTVTAADTSEDTIEITADWVNVTGFTVAGATTDDGLYLNGVEHCNISDNHVTNNGVKGIRLSSSDNNALSNNTVTSNDGDGIFVFNSDYNTISNNTATSNDGDGISVYQNSDYNTLSNNTANGNGDDGIQLFYWSTNNVLEDNSVSSNSDDGIYFEEGCNYNELTNNTVNSNTYIGINLYKWSKHNTLTSNTASSNGWYGIYLENKCNDTQLVNNIANSNTGYHGILLDQSCSCTLENNTANSNTYYGSYLYRSSNNNLINNTVSNNNRGIVLSYSSNDNTITGNTVNSNDDDGIYLNSSSNNQISNNYFDNNNNAYDNGNNTWNTTKTAGTNIIGGSYLGGNYWSDYTGVDNNEDGLGDTLLPYTCSGSIQNEGDFLPLIESSGEIYVPDDYPTIQSAVENASNGDTIIVRDGTYNENVHVDKRLVIRSENGAASTTIHAADTGDHVVEVQRDYVDINGFTVEGCTGPGKAGIYLNSVDHCNISDNNAQDDHYGIYLLYSDYNTLTNNTASSNGWHGIKLAHSSSNNLTNNYANSNGKSGILLQSSSNYNTFTNNHANSNGDGGIYFDGSSSDSNHNIFTGNTLNSNDMGVYVQSSDYCDFTNNTISSNDDEGMWFTGSSYNTIESNAITDNTGIGLRIASISNTVRYNTVASNKDGIYLWDACNNNISCNWVHNNNEKGFHLTSGSTDNIIGNNNIMSNGASANDSWHYNFYNDQENAVTVANNYWGTDNETLIAESIYDWNENSSKGNVTFGQRSGPAPCAPIPELATVVLFSMGLLVLAGYVVLRRRI